MERLAKETGEDAIYADTAALVRDGEAALKVVHKPDAWANFPRMGGDDPEETLRAQDEYKRNAELPITWRNEASAAFCTVRGTARTLNR